MTTAASSRDALNRARDAVESRSTDVDCGISAYHAAVRDRENLEAECHARLSPFKDNLGKFSKVSQSFEGSLAQLTKDGESLRAAQDELVQLWVAAGKHGKAREAATDHLRFWNDVQPTRRFSDGGIMHNFVTKHRGTASDGLASVTT